MHIEQGPIGALSAGAGAGSVIEGQGPGRCCCCCWLLCSTAEPPARRPRRQAPAGARRPWRSHTAVPAHTEAGISLHPVEVAWQQRAWRQAQQGRATALQAEGVQAWLCTQGPSCSCRAAIQHSARAPDASQRQAQDAPGDGQGRDSEGWGRQLAAASAAAVAGGKGCCCIASAQLEPVQQPGAAICSGHAPGSSPGRLQVCQLEGPEVCIELCDLTAGTKAGSCRGQSRGIEGSAGSSSAALLGHQAQALQAAGQAALQSQRSQLLHAPARHTEGAAAARQSPEAAQQGSCSAAWHSQGCSCRHCHWQQLAQVQAAGAAAPQPCPAQSAH
jgi:hypothetical protein